MSVRCSLTILCFFIIHDTYLAYYFFFFNDTATTEIYTLSLHDALPISPPPGRGRRRWRRGPTRWRARSARRPGSTRSYPRSEEHTSELQSQSNLVCRLLLEKKKTKNSAVTPDRRAA